MTWTTPLKTFVTGAALTASDLNTYVRDNLNSSEVGIVTAQGDIVYSIGPVQGALVPISGSVYGDFLESISSIPQWAFSSDHLIASTVLGSTGTSIVLPSSGSLNQGFKNLRIHLHARVHNNAGNLGTLNIRFNGDTGANYDWLEGYENNGTFTTTATARGDTSIAIDGAPEALTTDVWWAEYIINIVNYSGTTMNKNLFSYKSSEYSSVAAGISLLYACGFWRSSSAITSITILPIADVTLEAGSAAYVFGLA